MTQESLTLIRNFRDSLALPDRSDALLYLGIAIARTPVTERDEVFNHFTAADIRQAFHNHARRYNSKPGESLTAAFVLKEIIKSGNAHLRESVEEAWIDAMHERERHYEIMNALAAKPAGLRPH